MSKSAYPETDDTRLADDPDAPTGEVNFHKRYTTGARDPYTLQNDTLPAEDPVDPGMGDMDRQIRRRSTPSSGPRQSTLTFIQAAMRGIRRTCPTS